MAWRTITNTLALQLVQSFLFSFLQSCSTNFLVQYYVGRQSFSLLLDRNWFDISVLKFPSTIRIKKFKCRYTLLLTNLKNGWTTFPEIFSLLANCLVRLQCYYSGVSVLTKGFWFDNPLRGYTFPIFSIQFIFSTFFLQCRLRRI